MIHFLVRFVIWGTWVCGVGLLLGMPEVMAKWWVYTILLCVVVAGLWAVFRTPRDES